MKAINHILLSMLLILIPSVANGQKTFSYSVNKIWDNNQYDAFTSLVKYKGKFYCAFREARGHIWDENGKAEGKIRIISSKSGKKWTSVALIGESTLDFRDPKLSITPDGKLMVAIGVSVYVDKHLKAQIPHVCFSEDGINYTKPERCKIEGQDNAMSDWIWRVTWHEGTGYAIDYFTNGHKEKDLWLLTTKDGINYKHLANIDIPDFPNESTIRFLPNGQMAIMVRRDAGDCMGYWAVSNAPYTEWNWIKMPFRLGGPEFIMLDNTKVIAASRCHHIPEWCTTALYEGNAQTGKFHQIAVLPSGGDTSYASMLVEGKELWITYYSGHEDPMPSIYLAKIPMSSFKK